MTACVAGADGVLGASDMGEGCKTLPASKSCFGANRVADDAKKCGQCMRLRGTRRFDARGLNKADARELR
jgi:hypothetical protein